MTTAVNSTQTAVLGGGCFWCLEAVFDQLDGVQSVESGYAGGRTPEPSYEEVCEGSSGHAEVVKIEFNPGILSFRDLLRVFFSIHDPTTLNRQGSDVGTQYRSVIYCQTPEQRADANAVIDELSREKLWSQPIVTEIADAAPFYPAEAYHQDYFERNGRCTQSGEVPQAARRSPEAAIGSLGANGAAQKNLRRRAPPRSTRIPARARGSSPPPQTARAWQMSMR
jgi:peptide-methionine (S)-S-oxide reductase